MVGIAEVVGLLDMSESSKGCICFSWSRFARLMTGCIFAFPM